jgi:hypothetical protein
MRMLEEKEGEDQKEAERQETASSRHVEANWNQIIMPHKC